ncbi:hypothetical protein SAMN03159496_03449 [Rhizobium sp. NFR07]|uniref:hypothetical protein n=1 Tax=Rhizobium sp. NFR07 TaxID=1566262 RepID=UPI0008EAC28D|nr:hypothetical protein [Rhizobium sp. NFR07]SFB39866.1 hypothetical protein SAMN03159496_03449 [Rhizobium sp. NFR07]
MQEFNASFKEGRYERKFSSAGNSGQTKLALGHVANNIIQVNGYVEFDRDGAYLVYASATGAGPEYTGVGRFGSSLGCVLKLTKKS